MSKQSCWQFPANVPPPLALEIGLDEIVEFQLPATPTTACFFPLDEQVDLLFVMGDVLVGEIEHPIDFDQAVNDLLQTLAEEPPRTLKEACEDIATLRRLAHRFESVARRLHSEARKREDKLQRSPQLLGECG